MANRFLPKVNPELCTLCGRCVRACPEAVVALEAGHLVFVRPDACTYCGLCEDLCPVNAIGLPYAIVWGEGADTVSGKALTGG